MKRRSFLKLVFALPLLTAVGLKPKKRVWRGPGESVMKTVTLRWDGGFEIVTIPHDELPKESWIIKQERAGIKVEIS